MTTPNGTLKSLETRLENCEATAKTTSQRFDSLYTALTERLSAKDDTVSRLKEQSEWILRQNDTLLKQIGLRWNLLTGLTTLVGIAFTITLGYQIWRVEQVMETKRALEQGTKLLAQNTQAYSEILSTLAHADTLMTESNREFQRAEYGSGGNFAAQAITLLRSALQKTGFEVTELQKWNPYDSATCSAIHRTQPAIPEKSSSDLDHALSAKALRSAVRDALFTAYDLHARASFFAMPRGDLRENGTILLALDDSRWEGYHWIGLAAEVEGAGSFAEATECFRRSVDKKKVGNKDYVNLSELYFIHSNFSESFKYSDRFLRPLNYRFRSPLDVVAQFYFSASGFLSDNILVNEKMPPQRFRETVQKLPDFTLEGTFASSDLTNYLSSSDFSVTPAKKQEIQLSADCLLDRKKCKI